MEEKQKKQQEQEKNIIVERIIKDIAKSFVLLHPATEISCYEDFEDLAGENEKKTIMERIRRASKDFKEVSQERVKELFDRGCSEALDELQDRRQEEQQQIEQQIVDKAKRDVISLYKRHPYISPKRIQELINLGCLNAQKELDEQAQAGSTQQTTDEKEGSEPEL